MGVGGVEHEIELYIPQKSKENGRKLIEGMAICYKKRSNKGPGPIWTRDDMDRNGEISSCTLQNVS